MDVKVLTKVYTKMTEDFAHWYHCIYSVQQHIEKQVANRQIEKQWLVGGKKHDNLIN